MSTEGLGPPPEDQERSSEISFVPVDTSAPPPSYEPPSIAKAWKFYHENLPKRIKVSKSSGPGVGYGGMLQMGAGNQSAQQSSKGTGYRLARPGEIQDPVSGEPARPYEICGSYKELDEFGIGISLYFRQLLLLFVVVGGCACVNLNTIATNSEFNPENTTSTLVGSVYGLGRDNLTFANQGQADIITCLVLGAFVFALKYFESKNIEQIDLAQQTPQDYAVRVTRVPEHMKNPDSYYHFFKKWGDVVFVSVALDNGPLLKKLADSRELDEEIAAVEATNASMVAAGKEVGEASKKKLGEMNNKKAELTLEVQSLTKPTYHAKAVYVIFNKESDQRACLRDCATGILEEQFNMQCFSMNDNSTMEGQVLRVDEPVEPSEVIYENLHLSFVDYWGGLFKSYAITAGILGVSFAILNALSVSVSDNEDGTEVAESSTGYASAIFVSLLNGMLPWTLKKLTLMMEVHVDEGDVQTSILRKLMIARCLNTAVLMYVVTDFDAQFSSANLSQVQSILIADCFTTPVIRCLNIYEHVMHYVVAPTKPTQSQMNVLFQGAYWNLAERYTDMIKTLFVGLFYSTIIPSSLFITSAAMLVTYIVDRYCLLRMWSRPPMYDESLATASRKMMVVSVWVHVVMARVFFSNWPYRNPAEKPDCNLFTCTDTANVWTDEQKRIVGVYEGVGIMIFVFGFWILFFRKITSACKSLCCQSVDEVGKASNVEYRNLTGVSAYVPNLKRDSLINPLFACDVSMVNPIYLPCRKVTLDGQTLDPSSLSLNSDQDMPLADAGQRVNFFGSCKYYAQQSVLSGQQQPQQVQAAPLPQQQMMRPAQPVAVQMSPTNHGGGTGGSGVGGFFTPGQQGGNPYRQQQGHMQMQQVQQVQQVQVQQVQVQQVQVQMPGVAVAMAVPQAGAAGGQFQPLPAGWEMKMTAQGQPYYVNHNTQTTQWTRPVYRAAAAPQRPGMAGMRQQSQGIVLPRGWELKRAPDGRPYYVDHNTGTTHWTPPQL
ncbi:hypothetical protein TrST_g8569 [Triparma strigata]|uniref:WW domain-containing protein n=1 Tax=Triparma strigata TaxID=1606541 RepID=A0A9W6ZEL8_9STRA|nr:hypothetical protein TrST_g8569 [Triparma strigata]